MKGGTYAMNILSLNQQIESIRNKLNEALSGKKELDEDEILECSQKLDKLIIKYYNEVYKDKGLKKAIV